MDLVDQHPEAEFFEQGVHGEPHYEYYCETESERLLELVLTERCDRVRVVAAFRYILAPVGTRLSATPTQSRLRTSAWKSGGDAGRFLLFRVK